MVMDEEQSKGKEICCKGKIITNTLRGELMGSPLFLFRIGRPVASLFFHNLAESAYNNA